MDYFLFNFSGVQFHYTMSRFYFYFEVDFYEKLEAYSGYPHG